MGNLQAGLHALTNNWIEAIRDLDVLKSIFLDMGIEETTNIETFFKAGVKQWRGLTGVQKYKIYIDFCGKRDKQQNS